MFASQLILVHDIEGNNKNIRKRGVQVSYIPRVEMREGGQWGRKCWYVG